LKSCRAETCRDPWQVLHPYDDDVKTLDDALDAKVSIIPCVNYFQILTDL
jgi:hypothetical protein